MVNDILELCCLNESQSRKLHERLNSPPCHHIVNAISLPYFTTFLLSFPRCFVSCLLDYMNPFSVSIYCLSAIYFLRDLF